MSEIQEVTGESEFQSLIGRLQTRWKWDVDVDAL